jgi:hypothetical protein
MNISSSPLYPAVSALVLVLSGCQSTKILPDKPAEGNLPHRHEKQISSINIPVKANIVDVEAIVNENLPIGVISSGSERVSNTTRYSYEVRRDSPVKLSQEGMDLIFRVPITIKAKGSYQACIGFWKDGSCCSTPNPFGNGCATPGLTETEHGDAAPTVDVELRTSINIKDDYTIEPKTYLKGSLSGDTHLHIDLIGNLIRININIKDKLEGPLQNFVNQYQRKIDEQIKTIVNNINSRAIVEDFWNKSQRQIQAGDFWLDISPKTIGYKNITSEGKFMRMDFSANAEIGIYDKPFAKIPKPLPPLQVLNNVSNKFHIDLPIAIKLDTISKLASSSLVGKTYNKDGIDVTIVGVSLYGARLNNVSALVAKLTIKGEAKSIRFAGDIYISAIPRLNDEKKLVYISDFKIDPNTSNFLVNNGLPFLIDSFYYKEAIELLKYSYADEYNKHLSAANEKLKRIAIGDFIINGKIDKVMSLGFYLTHDDITLNLIGDGAFESAYFPNKP